MSIIRRYTVVSFCALTLLILTSPLHAETLKAFVRLTPEAVTPSPATPFIGLSLDVAVRVEVIRDDAGKILGGNSYFRVFYTATRVIDVSGLTICEGSVIADGPDRIATTLAGRRLGEDRSQRFLGASAENIDPATLQRLLANPAGFYLELKTTEHPNGALRGQLHTLTESIASAVDLSPMNVAPPVTGVAAGGSGTITLNPTRNAQGEITGGRLSFSVIYNLPQNSEIIGLNLHRQTAGMNGEIVVSSGLSASNSVLTPTGKGMLSLTVLLQSGDVETIKQLLIAPAGFYVNLQTRTFGNGLIRGQLTSFAEPPVIHATDTTFRTTEEFVDNGVELFVSNFDINLNGPISPNIGVLINGESVGYSPKFPAAGERVDHDLGVGIVQAFTPREIFTNGGVFSIQIRNSKGLLSLPSTFVIARKTS